jgi:hypothetical protein
MSLPSPPPPPIKQPSPEQLFAVCERFGAIGLTIWEAAKAKPPAERLPFVKQELWKLSIAVKNARLYVNGRPPVDFRTFVESNEYLHMPNVLYPKVMEEAAELNSGRYVEAVLTGAIGTGKTTIAVFTTAYQLYWLSCFKSPHAEWALAPSDEIVVVCQTLNANLAKDVDYRRLRNVISMSPYFKKQFPFRHDLEGQMEFPNNIIVKPVSGEDTAIIGQNVIGGILDEVNFMAVVEKSKQVRDGGIYDQAALLYDAIHDRRASRFMFKGELPGMLCLVSSKQYPGEFTDKKIAERDRELKEKKESRIFVYDKREWEVKDPEKFTGEWFTLFLGDETRKPRILNPNEEVPEADAHLHLEIPLEFMPRFESNMLKAIRDIAGHSTYALYPYILEPEKVERCFGRVGSILSRDQCDFKMTTVQAYPKRFRNLQQPRWVHLDLSQTGDSTGVACGYVKRFVEIIRSGTVKEILPEIVYDFVLEVTPPKNGEIQFSNIRELLYNLRKLGLPIKWVTLDTFQSTDMRQILAQQGFVTGIRSLDETTMGYDIAKQALMDNRVLAPTHYKAMMEFIRLERDPVKHKIDHPINFSKDCSDAMAGVAWGLTMQREVWALHDAPLMQLPPDMVQGVQQIGQAA